MASTDASYYPIYGQAYRVSGCIVTTTTGIPISGAFTGVTGTASKDGGAFSATGVTVTQIGTTGYFYIDLTSAVMTANTVIVSLAVSNANARDFYTVLLPIVLTESAGHWLDATVKRPEQGIVALSAILSNYHTLSSSTETVYGRDNSTTLFTGTVSGLASAGTATRNKMS